MAQGRKSVYHSLCESVDGVKHLKSVEWESRGSFMNDYVRLEKPVIVRNFVKRWGAAKKWTPEFFLNYVTPTRPEGSITSPTVTVSVGNEESSTSGSHKEKISLREYMEGIIEKKHKSAGCDVSHSPYLKQLDVFQALPALKKDIDANPFSWWHSVFRSTYLWIGGHGSMTGLHNDDENNVLCQIYGKKTVYLYPPETRAFLYVNGNYDSGTECCDVDVVDSAAEQYPNFSRAKPFEIKCSLKPGDML